MRHWVRNVVDDLQKETCSPLSPSIRADLRQIVSIIEEIPHHVFRKSCLERVADEIQEAQEVSDLANAMWEATIECEFQNFIIFVLKQGPGNFSSRICTSLPTNWTEYYEEKRYQYVDPVLIAAMEQDEPIVFADLPDAAPAVSKFWLDAERIGVGRNGVCFPYGFSDGSRLGVSFCTANGLPKAQASIRRNACDLSIIAYLACEAFKSLASGTQSYTCPLTDRELRFLHLLATSKDPDIAFNLNNGFGSNDALQRSIRNKLGVTTVFQAIATSASRGWFDQLPFSAGEVDRPYPSLTLPNFFGTVLDDSTDTLELQQDEKLNTDLE